jgi:hypothetical protein
MSFSYDRLYILRDDNDKPTARVLSFLNDCIIDINRLAMRKVYILVLDKHKFMDKQMVSALTSRGIKALPALEIRSESKIIEGTQNIIDYYHQLTSAANSNNNRQQPLHNPMMMEPSDPYKQYYANDMFGGDTGGDDGEIGENWNDVNTSLANRSSYSTRQRDRVSSMMSTDEAMNTDQPPSQQQMMAPTPQKRKMPSQIVDDEISTIKLDPVHAPKDIGKTDDALEAALMDKLGNVDI